LVMLLLGGSSSSLTGIVFIATADLVTYTYSFSSIKLVFQ
jgi:hypothetical protein